VLTRLQTFACQAFPGEHPRLELFGSLVTGLALESSDMDLAVTGLHIDDRYQMINDLKNLAAQVEGWRVLDSFKAIETASIPVIKMKVDLVKLRELEMPEREPGDYAKRPIPAE
jgi:DNA polymerase sigma